MIGSNVIYASGKKLSFTRSGLDINNDWCCGRYKNNREYSKITLIVSYIQYSSRVFCLLPRTTAMSGRVAERGGHSETSFPRKHVEHRVLPPRFSTHLHKADRRWIYPLLSHAVHRKSRWTLRFAKIAWASVIYVLLLILSYIYFCISGLKNKRIKTSAY